MQRPTSVTVFAILNMLFGTLGVFFTGLSLLSTGIAATLPRNRAGEESTASLWIIVTIVYAIIAIAYGCLLASGIGLWNLRPWARTLAVRLALVVMVLIAAIFALVVMGMWASLTDGMDDAGPAELAVVAITFVVVAFIYEIYPVLLWYFLTRPHVVYAFANSGGTVAADAPWSPPADPLPLPAESSNPFASPVAETTRPLTAGGPPPAMTAVIDTFVPAKNGAALLSYYLGLFSLLPCLGFPLGVTAVYLGLKGRRNALEDPAVRGGAHAWVGIICGSLFGLFNFLLLVVAILALAANATTRR